MVVIRRIGLLVLGLTVLAPVGCANSDLTPTSWTDGWKNSPIQGAGWKKQSGAWSFSSEGREIERNFGFE
jgi:hypothetical protein